MINRRKFIKNTAAGIIGYSLLPGRVTAAPTPVPLCIQSFCNPLRQDINQAYNTDELLNFYDKHTRGELKTWDAYYGDASIIEEARAEFELLIPFIPYLGENLHNALIHSFIHLAKCRVQKRYGTPVEDIAAIQYEALSTKIFHMPWLIRLQVGRSYFTKEHLNQLKDRCIESQKRIYPDDWVSAYVEGDGQTFDYGIDISECPLMKTFPGLGAEEFIPWICPLDDIVSDTFGQGLVRTTTLAWGGDTCDFRFKRKIPPFRKPERDYSYQVVPYSI